MDDFHNAVFNETIPAGTVEDIQFRLHLVPDDVIEGNEVVLLMLKVLGNTTGITVGPHVCAVGRIQPDRNLPSSSKDISHSFLLITSVFISLPLTPHTVIRVESDLSPDLDNIQVREGAGVVLLLTVTKTVDTELPISVTVTANEGDLQ